LQFLTQHINVSDNKVRFVCYTKLGKAAIVRKWNNETWDKDGKSRNSPEIKKGTVARG